MANRRQTLSSFCKGHILEKITVTTFRGGLTSVQFLSVAVVRDVAVVGETEENMCSVDEEACVVVFEDSEVKGVVGGHGPWNGAISHSLLQSE